MLIMWLCYTAHYAAPCVLVRRQVTWCAAWWPNTPDYRLRRYWKTHLICHVYMLCNKLHGAAYSSKNQKVFWKFYFDIIHDIFTYWLKHLVTWNIARGLEVRLITYCVRLFCFYLNALKKYKVPCDNYWIAKSLLNE